MAIYDIKIFLIENITALVSGAHALLGLGSYLQIDDEKTVYLLPEVSTEIFTNVKESYLESKG